MQDCDKIINYDLHWNPVRLIQRFGRIDRIGSEHDEIFGYNFLPETSIEENLGLREKLESRIREIQETIGEDVAILDPAEKVNAEAMYAIYETDGAGTESLGLFDEDATEDEHLVDLGEALEMFRQLREENPEEFGRISHLRDGIRAARQASAAEGELARRGAYVYCRAGVQGRFYFVDDSGAAEEVSTQRFLGALRCAPEEPGEPLPAGHNALVRAARPKLVELERKRDKYQEMFAATTMTLDELRVKLDALEEARETAERELASVVDRRERLEAMERDRDLILESYAALAPEALDALSPEERRRVYVILNLTVEPLADGGLQISGAFGEEPVWEDVGTSTR
jgi:hypothetical protein